MFFALVMLNGKSDAGIVLVLAHAAFYCNAKRRIRIEGRFKAVLDRIKERKKQLMVWICTCRSTCRACR